MTQGSGRGICPYSTPQVRPTLDGMNEAISRPRQPMTIAELRDVAQAATAGEPRGEGLSDLERALIGFGLAAATTALDIDGMRACADEAAARGATADQLTCVLLLVTGLGMHTLHEGVRELRPVVEELEPSVYASPLTPEQEALKQELEGDSSYWARLETQLPGFLDGLLRLAPTAYQRFFEFCALAWETDSLDARTKELVYLAVDASPTHRYGPGFRLHLDNARRMGASPMQIDETLDLAAQAPPHRGVSW